MILNAVKPRGSSQNEAPVLAETEPTAMQMLLMMMLEESVGTVNSEAENSGIGELFGSPAHTSRDSL
ncbi:hypothetical protein PHSY_001093 [Pseudozyma hubeiensis SY62]|uniref:Uncharacterized protein n=1 Tax=Pseudozyma hubeiensis (strain SY62) TaxID=1305764 RepID=R9NXR3_PSEHS|nr:hypothetical protein PHSY_001093 [Pseudozyma hubeiensis SY62]GAC93528.1 hypothetical protein PHSY_001093 [Pseudozyma hubeiensis SY62]